MEHYFRNPGRPTRRTLLRAGAFGLIGVAVRPAAARDPFAEAAALYGRKDYVAAAQIIVPLAASGDARAQGLLGLMYEYGQGVPQDFALAVEWYSCAANQGDATAQYLLGLMYDLGRGVRVDVVQAQKWLILAASRAGKRERDAYARVRDAMASKMSRAQIGEAQTLARDFVPVGLLPPR
ncbi:tetratricopeptide repeat protein [Xanthobacter autotrophicus DSM 431]|uniref:tetratricopeptide repeat protein n=1 Tax=Xanthobacter nonsaccharivorans TaxID=3119912 RepID=UPI0037264700